MNIIEAYTHLDFGGKIKRKGWEIYYKACKEEDLVNMYNCCDNSLVDIYELDSIADVMDILKSFMSIEDILADDWEVVE